MNVNKALFTFIKIIFSIMIVLLLVYGTLTLSRAGYDYGYRLFAQEAPSTEEAEKK